MKLIQYSSHMTRGTLKTFLSLKLKLPEFLSVSASELPSFLSIDRKAFFVSSYPTEFGIDQELLLFDHVV